MSKVLVIGAGKGGLVVLNRLLRSTWVQVVGVADQNPEALAIPLAKKEGLPIFTEEPLKVLQGLDVDLVFDLTGDPSFEKRLSEVNDRPFSVISGQATQLLWNAIRELEDKEEQLNRRLREHRILSEINLLLTRSVTDDQIFEAIVSGMLQMTGMPAGSLSMFNKEKQELYLVSAKGFSSEFYKNAVYPVRPGGLTEQILSQKKPLLVPDINDFPAFNNPVILKEGVRSLIAIPLISEKGPVGILYGDDFRPRAFEPSIVETLRALGTQAVINIQKQQAFQEIKNLSIRDSLTGLYNRRYLDQVLRTEMERASRLQHPLSLILLDIDHFKDINDKYGHVTGDQVLQDLSKLFGSIIRPYDTFARFGGEEFLILMSETDEDFSVAFAERLRVVATEKKFSSKEIPLTCSFGVSTFRWNKGPLPDLGELLERADRALYQAKRAGRNRVISLNNDSQAAPLPDSTPTLSPK
ncbi:MAG: diguanylate cyclase [Nitrospiria bacterium]